MENISIQILRICIIVCVTEFQTGQLILVPEPCPGFAPRATIEHTTGDNKRIQINCSLSYMQTTQQDKTLSSNMPTIQQDKTISSNMQTTQHMTDVEIQDDTTGQIGDAAIEDKTVSDTDSTLYIAIGVGSAVVIALIVLVTIIIIIRRKDNTNTNGIEVQPDTDSNDDDSDGLKYNCLYNASEQQDIMEGDYHTVELEGTHNRTGTHNLDSDYSTVGGNYSSVDIVNMPLHEGTKSDSNIQSTPTTSPKSEIQRTEEATSNNLKDVTAGSNAEYAIVNKSRRTDQNIKHVTAPDDRNVEYAVVDKKKCINN